jgi:hypothetical protein
LLGIYLGDGTISRGRKGIWRLRVFQDTRYPQIVGEIVRGMIAVMPQNRVRVTRRGATNCVEIGSGSKSWPCLFPQAGPGRKHERKIELTAWQWAYVWQEPGMFVRGLIHSDGCRVMNRVHGGKYAYPRYFFCNHSLDIQQMFREACDLNRSRVPQQPLAHDQRRAPRERCEARRNRRAETVDLQAWRRRSASSPGAATAPA